MDSHHKQATSQTLSSLKQKLKDFDAERDQQVAALKRLHDELLTYEDDRNTAVQWVKTERFSLKNQALILQVKHNQMAQQVKQLVLVTQSVNGEM